MGAARQPAFKHALPHRGDGSAPHVPAADAPARLAELIEGRRARLDSRAWSAHSDPELVAAAEEHLTGGTSPLGAAIALALIRRLPGPGTSAQFRSAVDAWVVERGPGFAVDAVMASAGITITTDMLDRPRPERLAPESPPRMSTGPDYPAAGLRRVLAGLGDPEHTEAVERIADQRTSVASRSAAAFLVPERSDWLDAAIAEAVGNRHDIGELLLCSMAGVDQLEQVKLLVDPTSLADVRSTMSTLAHRVGPLSAGFLLYWLRWIRTAADRRAVLDVLAHLDSDEAFAGLIRNAGTAAGAKVLGAAVERFPQRATRMLADRLATAPRDDLTLRLRSIVLGHPAVPEAVVQPERPAGDEVPDTPAVPDAPAAALPPVLLDPPWQREPEKKLAAVGGLVAPHVRRVTWADGEREQWLQEPGGFARGTGATTDWAVYRHYEGRSFAPNWAFQLAGAVPVELLLPALPHWELTSGPTAGAEDMRYAAARLELAVLPHLLAVARRNPGLSGGALAPFLDTDVAVLLAAGLARQRVPHGDAIEYFERHGLDAARLVVPTAVGRRGPERKGAEAAVRLVAAEHGDAAVIAVAAEFGAKAAAATAEILAGDAPPRPAPGPWVEPAALPVLLLADRRTAVPAAHVPDVVAALSLCRPGEPYAGALEIRDAVDRTSFAELGRTLLTRWEQAGAPAKDAWVLAALAVTGDEETTRTLARRIVEWPRQGGHSRAVTGLDVLAGIGDEIALMELDRIARTAPAAGIKKRAGELLTRLAEQLELSSEQLADRLVPALGLDANGSMDLYYGSQTFTVGFDENLLPFVVDASGHRRRNLPRPGAKDDPALAPAAHRRFATLTADVTTIVKEQVRRLERAMIIGRRWSGREFIDVIAGHPLMSLLARRILWGRFDGADVIETFRLAEDRTLAGVDDTAITLADDASVGVVHPVQVPALVEAWTEVFSDYEIMQPFPQLGRPVFAVAAGGLEQELRPYENVAVSTGRVLALTHRGWKRDHFTGCVDKPLASGARLSLWIEPGLEPGDPMHHPEQKVVRVGVVGAPDAVEASELLADLAHLMR